MTLFSASASAWDSHKVAVTTGGQAATSAKQGPSAGGSPATHSASGQRQCARLSQVGCLRPHFGQHGAAGMVVVSNMVASSAILPRGHEARFFSFAWVAAAPEEEPRQHGPCPLLSQASPRPSVASASAAAEVVGLERLFPTARLGVVDAGKRNAGRPAPFSRAARQPHCARPASTRACRIFSASPGWDTATSTACAVRLADTPSGLRVK